MSRDDTIEDRTNIYLRSRTMFNNRKGGREGGRAAYLNSLSAGTMNGQLL